MGAAELIEAIRALPVEERLMLVDQILETVETAADPAVEAAWLQEVRERIAAIDSGEMRMLSEDEFFASLPRL